MPKTVGYSRDNIQDTIGVIDKFITWLDQPLLTTSNVLFNALNTTEDVVIGGNLTVNGVSTIISTEIVEIQDNILLTPGTNIKSTFPNNKENILQGTSMATPHITGIYALMLSETPLFSPEEMKKLVVLRGTKDIIKGDLKNSPNCLGYSL